MKFKNWAIFGLFFLTLDPPLKIKFNAQWNAKNRTSEIRIMPKSIPYKRVRFPDIRISDIQAVRIVRMFKIRTFGAKLDH